MTDTVIEEQPEAAPVEPSQLAPAPAEPDLDALLAQFDQGTNAHTPDNGSGSGDHDQAAKPPDPQFQEGELDKLLSELNADTDRANNLQAEVNSLKHAEMMRVEQEAFGKYADELQSKLPDHCPPDYARNALLSAAAVNRSLAVAWDNRNLSAAERANAAAELRAAELLYRQIQQMPNTDPRKQTALQQIWQQGTRLEMIVAGPALLRRTLLDIEKRARDFQPIDREASELKADIAWQMKSAGGKRVPEPPPNYGTLSNTEFRQKVRDEHGFDPIT
jgi:hypothetical protein